MPQANHLAQEKSPYLLQHAYNPVDWYPWGEEAFDKARRENKPIFLSIGYSTCHWCHVMERESFENESIAALLNRDYVSIKVDREERPDVDQVYMTFVQATTGGGGWPMSVFLTPDLKPFFGGTYFPPESRYGSPGFRQVLLGVADKWENEQDDLLTSADRVMEALSSIAGNGAAGPVSEDLLRQGYRYFASAYDKTYGGFEGAPKFPRPVVFNFLMRYFARTGQQDALRMVVQTLKKMARGGIYDHLGGGFHRYSVDAQWHVPHFEKMLYDQAQIVMACIEAWQATHDDGLADVARDVLRYVLRDLRAPQGAFWSAEDADSVIDAANPHEKGEGAFYVWSDGELGQHLDADVHSVFDRYYGVQAEGNVDHDPHGEFTGKNILHVQYDLDVLADMAHRPVDAIGSALAAARVRLFEVRSLRPRPHLDDKILTSWNGLMISALACAAQALDDATYRTAALEAATFIWERLRDGRTGELRRRYRDGQVAIEATLDDYAFSVQGLIDLYEATLDVTWLTRARDLQTVQNTLFWDAQGGGFFDTTGRDASVLLRSKSDYDGAEPSGNSVAALNLLRLAQMTDTPEWSAMGMAAIKAFARRTPAAIPQLMVAADWALSKPVQIVVAGLPQAADTRAMLAAVRERFIPHRVLLLADGGPQQAELASMLPFVRDMGAKDGRATGYVCENYACQLPVNDLEAFKAQLDHLAARG